MRMVDPQPVLDDDEAAEAAALAAAIAESDADPRVVPHEDVRAWLLRLAAGEFEASPPEPR
jgi:predicted transcriptional regulator